MDVSKEEIRQPELIQKIFNRLIFDAGEKQYRIKILEAELGEINQKLFHLGKEYDLSLKTHNTEKKDV